MSDIPRGEILFFQTDDGHARIECRFAGDSIWLSINQMAELFGRDKSVISKHLKSIFEDGELPRDSVVAKYATTAADGKTYRVDYYNLEAIFAVGYRVRSPRGIEFRACATARLRDFVTQGFVMDEERLKNPDSSVYFERLLEKIRDIRSSEKVFWRKICDIYATSLDYDGKAETSQTFFAQIQNKVHWAAHGHTAAEIVHLRADATQPHMGLNHLSGPEPLCGEVTVAKNYLTEPELKLLNRIVTAYLEFAELQADRRRPMHMVDWTTKLDDFLKLGDHDLLTHAGKIFAEQAKQKAHGEYECYRKILDVQRTAVDKDLEAALKKLPRKGRNP